MNNDIILATIALIGTIATPIITVIGNKQTTKSTIQKELSVVQNATKSSLCESLVRRGKEIKKAKKVSEDDYKRFVEDYNIYKSLPNANGYVDDLKESVERIYLACEEE